ncbi:MAG: type II toxin-antitoxin system RelE/ParE family toxin [Eubacterium sp.]|nr:type II toxin-antitoxin system RelE/ParE family toxin [Eubacterium sp.]
MYKIVITNPAENDLRDAISYISNKLKNKIAAKNLLDETENMINSLSDMPERYSVVNDAVLAAQGIRMINITNYSAFYVVREESKSITVLRFLFSRRDWINILKD